MKQIKDWIVNHKKSTIAILIGIVFLIAIGSIVLTFNARQVKDSRKSVIDTGGTDTTKVVETKKDENEKEVKAEITKETSGNAVVEKPVDSTTNTADSSNSNSASNNSSTPQVQSETKVNDTTIKKVEKTVETIPFIIIDAYANTGAQSRVYQEGVNGQKEIRYEVIYTNGKETSRKKIGETITVNPKNRIIERYIEVSPRKVEIQEVEDKNQPVYKYIVKDRWFVRVHKTGEFLLFYSSTEAYKKHEDLGNNGLTSNWGTYEPEKVYTDEVAYYKKIKQEVVQEAIYEWSR